LHDSRAATIMPIPRCQIPILIVAGFLSRLPRYTVHPDLAAVIEETKSEHLTFLTTRGGKPFVPGSFANWFREMCNKAGLSGLSAHGLRKAACRRLAEAGCSANVIAAISGHASLREVQRYTAAADQARMARTAIESMMTSFPSTRTSGGKPEC